MTAAPADGAREPTIVAIGDFGRAVADRLTPHYPGVTVRSDAPAGAGRPVVLVAWREARAVALAIDADPTVPWWLPVVLAHPIIRVGPVLSPDTPGCYRCLTGRVLSADDQPGHLSSLWDGYDHDPSLGPTGYLAHHSGVAAGLARLLIRHREPARRRIYSYDVLRGDLRSDTLVPFHDCPRWPRPTADDEVLIGGRP